MKEKAEKETMKEAHGGATATEYANLLRVIADVLQASGGSKEDIEKAVEALRTLFAGGPGD